MVLPIGIELWHSHYKKGTLCGNEGILLNIDFEEYGKKYVSKDALGHGLYLAKEEVNYTDYKFLLEKYNASPDLLGCSPFRDEAYIVSINEKGEYRSFVILSVNTAINKGNIYYKIFAIDVQTATLVVLVDTNGMALGLHTEQDSIKKLRVLDVIHIFVKPALTKGLFNAIRIAGEIQVIGVSHLVGLEKKYSHLKGHQGYPNHTIKMTFQELFSLAHSQEEKEVAGLVRFADTEIRLKQGKTARYQMKMGPIFADLEGDLIQPQNDMLYYRGYVLATAYVPSGEHRARVRVVKLFGKPSSRPNQKKKIASLETKAKAFVHGLTRFGSRKMEMELRKALCDMSGTLTEARRQLYVEALSMLQRHPNTWSEKQRERFFDGMLFFALKAQNPDLDHKKWTDLLFQHVDNVNIVGYSICCSYGWEEYKEGFWDHYLKVTSIDIGPIPEHRFKLYIEVMKSILDAHAGFYLEYPDDEDVVGDSEHEAIEEGDSYAQCDDSYYNDWYEEYREYDHEEELQYDYEEELQWDIDL